MDMLYTLLEMPLLKFIIFAVIWLVGILSIGDYYGRLKRNDLLNYLKKQDIATVHVNAYCSLSTHSVFSHRFKWEHAELVLTDECIYYFGYHNFWGWRRMYGRNIQLCLLGTMPVTLSIEPRFYIITSSKFANSVWEIHFTKGQKSTFSSTNKLRFSSLSLESHEVILQFHNKIAALTH